MSSHSDPSDDTGDGRRHDHDADPATDRVHDNSWSADLETPRHADDRGLVVRHAVEAVAHTAPGYHVNLVSHAAHGHPETYLFGALADAFDGRDVEWEYVEQCGCGGHVTRVHVGGDTAPGHDRADADAARH